MIQIIYHYTLELLLPNKCLRKRKNMLRLRSCIRSGAFRHGVSFLSEEWDLAPGLGHVSGPRALAGILLKSSGTCSFQPCNISQPNCWYIHQHYSQSSIRLKIVLLSLRSSEKTVLVITLATWRSGLFHVSFWVRKKTSWQKNLQLHREELRFVTDEWLGSASHQSCRLQTQQGR